MKRRQPLKRSQKRIRRTPLQRSRRPIPKAVCLTESPTSRIKVVFDRTSPDGTREVRTGEEWQRSRYETALLSGGTCEGCEIPHPAPFPAGEAHHLYGRGGGRRDDRPMVPMQTIESEPNLARWRWHRNLLWCCSRGHERQERMFSSASHRRARQKFCECGLLIVDIPRAVG